MCSLKKHILAACCCRLENGTTYNAYLIFGDKTALVRACHAAGGPLWIFTAYAICYVAYLDDQMPPVAHCLAGGCQP
jgi:hypothetical protein